MRRWILAWAMALALVLQMGCVTTGTMTTAVVVKAVSDPDNLIETAAYFKKFIAGIEATLPYAKQYFPSWSDLIDEDVIPLVAKADAAANCFEHGAKLYKAGKMGLPEVLAQRDEVFRLIEDLKTLYKVIKGE